MDSRERVERCLCHREPDRVPIDFWAAPEIEAALMRHFGAVDREALLRRLDADFRYIEGPRYVGPVVTRPDGSREDHFGVPRRAKSYGEGARSGTYSEVTEYPLEKAGSVDEILSYPKWPQPDWFDYEVVREQARRARETGKAVVFMGDRLNRCAQLKPAMYVRGVEQILVDVMIQPDVARAVFERITEFYLEYARRTLEAGGGAIDIFFTGDDFGTQENLFMAPDLWRSLLRDGFKALIDLGHAYGCRVAHHTCGMVLPLIEDFIGCGLDILNPLQPEAPGMDHAAIKRQAGDRLAFHGGISIQRTMPYGSPDEVRREVGRCVEALAPGGGYIFCTAHNLQVDTPIANIEALFRAYRELGAYGGREGRKG